MTDTVCLMVLCNDHRNGDGLDRIGGIDVSEHDIELRSGYLWTSDWPRFRRLPGKAVRISRRKFPILGYRFWVGNWCWDAITVEKDVAREIIRYLYEDCKFSFEAYGLLSDLLPERLLVGVA